MTDNISENTRELVGERLKTIRKDVAMSQSDFATELGTSASYVSDIEKGKSSIGINLLITLKRRFKIRIDWLISGEGEMYDIARAPSGAAIINEGIVSKGEYLKLQAENEKLSTTIDVLLSKLFDQGTYLQRNRNIKKENSDGTKPLKKVAEKNHGYNP